MDFTLRWSRDSIERLRATAQNGLEVLRLGGLKTGSVPSPSQIVESVLMRRCGGIFRRTNRPGQPMVVRRC